MDENIKRDLIDIVGEPNYTGSLIDLVSSGRDASEHRERPGCAVRAASAEQIADIMKLADREKIPVIPGGAGTGLSGMAVPSRGAIFLDTGRMNRIIRISIEDRLAVVEPGVIHADLEEALAPHGFFFPPDPAGGKRCSLGGSIATNAVGVTGAKYGTPRDYVLALQVVLPDGRIMRTGSGAMKSVSGYDLTRLFVGSEGTLGVVAEITLKINPKPAAARTAAAAFDNLADAERAVGDIMQSDVIPGVLEIVGREALAAVSENTKPALAEVEAMLLAETDGYTDEEAEYQIRKIIDVLNRNRPLWVQETGSADLFKPAADPGETLTGDPGIGPSRAPCMRRERDATAVDVMRGIKRTFDPNNILNPGKMALENG